MTIKEIAKLCGVKDNTVSGWINRTNFLNSNFELRNQIREKLNKGSPEHPSDYDLEETLAIIGDGGKNHTLAALLAENAANRNALTVQNDVSSRLDRIENAIAQLALGLKQANNGKTKILLENKHDKERYFYDFVEKNICISNHFRPVKRVKIWERYTEAVKKADRMNQKVFFDRLGTIFPSMKINKTRVGPHFQFFCYGIYLNENSYSSSSS